MPMQRRDMGSRSITRDGFHLSYLYRRYAVALMWARELMGMDIMANDFVPHIDFIQFENADSQILKVIKQIVADTM